MRRLGLLMKGIGALVLLVLLLVGVPLLLVRTAGWPLPTSIPSTEAVGDALTRTGVPSTTVLKAVAVVVWLAWLQLLVGVATEVVASWGGRPSARGLATVPPVRQLAATLVSSVVALVGALGPVGSVGATTASPLPLAQALAAPAAGAAPRAITTTTATDLEGVHASTWTVQRRDTLWGIAEEALGRGERWREIASLNVGREVAPGVVFTGRSEVLRVGWRLALPAEATTSLAPSVPTRSEDGALVTVARGDTLWALAERCYGDATRWTILWEANQGRRFGQHVFDDPNLIFAGWQLKVPAGPEPAIVDPSATPPSDDAPPDDTSPDDTSPDDAPTLAAEAPTSAPRAAPPSGVADPVLVTALGASRPVEGSDVGTAPPVTRPTPPPVEVGAVLASAGAEDEGSPSGSGWTIATGLAGATLLATGVTGLLSSRRRRRMERLAADEALPAPDPDLAPIERTLRLGADPLATVRLAVSLRALAALTRRPETADLRPVAVRRSPAGDLEFLLAAPVPVVAPWTAAAGGDDGAVWRLAAGVALAELAALGAGVPSPCPAMVLLGAGDSGELYLDLEAAGLVALGGRREEARAIARGIIASLAVSPLADRVHVVAAGIDCYGFANERRVHAVADGAEGVELATSLARPIDLALEQHGLASTFALRAARPEELWEPVVLVTPGGVESDLWSGPTELGGRGLAVLTGVPVEARWRLELDGPSWRLEPLGATVVPQGLAADELADLGALLVDAATEPVALNPRPGPPGTDEAFEEPAWALLVRVLGPVDVIDATGRAASFERAKALELAVWLAEHRHRPTRASARAALWETDVRDATFANVVSDARRAMARLVEPPTDAEWIGRTYGEDLPLHRLVMTDADLLGARLEHARRQPDEQAVETLREGLLLVRDLPFAGTNFLWPDGEALPSHHTVLVVNAAVEMATRCLRRRDVDSVFWATSQGMKALPAHDELVALRMRAHAAQGNLAGVRQEYESYERVIMSDPWGDGTPSPKVVELRRGLVRPVPSR